MTTTFTTITASEATTTKIIPVTCNNDKDPQACAHYYSAIHVQNKESSFECTDGNTRSDAVATASWTNQHKNYDYWSYTNTNLEWNGKEYGKGNWKCDADEYRKFSFCLDYLLL